ncbi:hypothetical protein ACHQM5_020490 [Ranunculus cassubicifolius]
MLPGSHHEIKQDDKFFSRLLSKEANPSFRVYYGGASGAIPFVWESQPGTPKTKGYCDTSLPPLTPPPSYQFNLKKESPKKSSKLKLLHTMFTRLINGKKPRVSPPPSFESSYSYSSSSLWSPQSHHRRRTQSSLSSLDSSRGDDEGEMSLGSPTSTLCFGRGTRGRGGFKARYSMKIFF